MTDAEVRDTAFGTLLNRHPEAVVAALAPDGFRVPVPAEIGLAEHQLIPVPADRATMVDLVISADAMTVITAWERALNRGMAITTVHTRNAPDHPVTMTFFDARDRYGVWLGAFTEQSGDSAASSENALAGALLVPLRPRTAVMYKTAHAIITGIDDRTTRMLGWSAEQIVGARSLEYIHPDDHARAVANWMEMLSKQESQRVRLRHRCQDGSWLWVETEHTFQHAESMEDVVIVAQLSDISDEMAAYEAVNQREKLIRRLAEALPIGLLQVDLDGALIYRNSRLATILGVAEAATLDEQLATVTEDGRPPLDAAFAAVLEHGTDQALEITIEVPGEVAELRKCAVTLIALSGDEGVPGALACITDITESAQMREELKIKATYDQLTGCYNRASVIAVLDHELTSGHGHQTGVVFIDLDRFKPINDSLGHAAGDQVLTIAAESIAGVLRERDVVGRIGGDEFLLVCQGLEGPAEALAIAERVSEVLHRQVPLAAGQVDLRASIGVTCSAPGTTSDELIARADSAMYESKQHGDGRPVLYRAPQHHATSPA
jgi:diguanylate cyclase (GGDEF)-like protein/PAS domain S-box-containing protein